MYINNTIYRYYSRFSACSGSIRTNWSI